MTGQDLINGILNGTIRNIGITPGCGGKSQQEPRLPPLTPDKLEGQHRIINANSLIDTNPKSIIWITASCPWQDARQIERALLLSRVPADRIFVDDLSRDTFETFIILSAILSQIDLRQIQKLPTLSFISAVYHYRVARIIAQGLGLDLKHYYPDFDDRATSLIYKFYPWYARYWDTLGEGWFPNQIRRRRNALTFEEFSHRCRQLFKVAECPDNHSLKDAYADYQAGNFFAYHFR